MQNEKLSQAKGLEPISVLLLPSPALLLAEGEAQIKAKAPRLRAQQRGRVAKGKKGRLKAALRYLRGVQADTIKHARSPIDFSRCGPLYRGPFRGTAQLGRPERKGKPSGALREMPPEEKKG